MEEADGDVLWRRLGGEAGSWAVTMYGMYVCMYSVCTSSEAVATASSTSTAWSGRESMLVRRTIQRFRSNINTYGILGKG